MRFKSLILGTLLSVMPVSIASAQSSDAATVEARARFTEGVKAFEAKKYEQARAAFTQAYALKPIPDILRNLGTVEIRSGHFRDGARHLANYLRTAPSLSEAERRDIDKELARAQPKLGRIIVVGVDDGTELTVDGEKVGSWISTEPLYVEPGPHEVVATRPGRKESRHTADTKPGEKTTVTLQVEPVEEEVTPLPASTTALPPTADAAEAPAYRERSIVPIIVGGSITALGLVGGIGFRLAASSKQDEADKLAPPTESTCYESSSSSCAALKDANSAVDRNKNLSTASFAVAATSGLLTLGYYLFWPNEARAGKVRPSAVASANGASVWLAGDF